MKNLSLSSIDDRYKNLENPFTSPEIKKNAEEERRLKIIEKIALERKNQNTINSDSNY